MCAAWPNPRDCGTEMNATNDFQNVPVAILCGGRGILLNEQQGRVNKALVEVQGKPMFAWVMLHYALYGARDFVLATGLQGERFAPALTALGAKAGASVDTFTLDLAGHACNIRLVATDAEAPTGARLLACKPYLNAPVFALTYSDTLSDVDLGAELRFHNDQGLVATLLGTTYPVRFRVLGIRQGESRVRAFAPRPVIEAASINGGYYLFTQKLWDAAYGLDSSVALENQPLEKLAGAAQLSAFDGAKSRWQHCDAERDLAALNDLAARLAAQAA